MRSALVVPVTPCCSFALECLTLLNCLSMPAKTFSKKVSSLLSYRRTNSVCPAYTHTGQTSNQRHLPVQAGQFERINCEAGFHPRNNNCPGQLSAPLENTFRNPSRDLSLRAPFFHPKIHTVYRLRLNSHQQEMEPQVQASSGQAHPRCPEDKSPDLP